MSYKVSIQEGYLGEVIFLITDASRQSDTSWEDKNPQGYSLAEIIIIIILATISLRIDSRAAMGLGAVKWMYTVITSSDVSKEFQTHFTRRLQNGFACLG